MVPLTRITGAQFALNPDLIERVDRTPDTIITLVDGTKYLVSETLEEVLVAVLEYRAQVLACASGFERVGDHAMRRTRLSAVPDGDELAMDSDGPVLPLAPRRP